MQLQFTILGSGTSYGVPMIGCHCPVCTSHDPRNRRTRAAGWLHNADKSLSILFDVGADMREQALREDICAVDAVFITHFHADHINGIDDLRGFTKINHGEVRLFAKNDVLEYIKRNFAYMFQDELKLTRGWDVPHISLNAINLDTVMIKDVPILPVPIIHGKLDIRGYRIGNFAYLTDCSCIPKDSYSLLQGLKNVVIDGLHWHPHSTHFNFEQAIEATKPLCAENVYLTHITHDIDHAVDEQKLPQGVHIAYDGLVIPVEVPDAYKEETVEETDGFLAADDEHIAREKRKAAELRKSQWWKNELAKGKCHYCGKSFKPSELTMDHIVPIVRGGCTTKGNVVPACKECNNKKKYMLPFEWNND